MGVRFWLACLLSAALSTLRSLSSSPVLIYLRVGLLFDAQGGRVAVKVIDCWAGAQPSAADRADLAAAGAPSQRRQQDVPAVEAALVEALLARSLSHPHIVTTYCHGATAPRVRGVEWNEMEWMP